MRAVRSRPGQVVGLEPGQPEYRVLIVEDHAENRLLLQSLLEAVGFRVQVAEDGLVGIQKFVAWQPHFIWMDWRLPGIDGLEATRRIRRLEGGKDVKIVALTASAFTYQREEALAAGMDDFLRKPYRREEIFDCMARRLGVRYRYGALAAESAAEPALALRPEALAALPEDQREALADALISLDMERIAGLIVQVSERDRGLGNVLARCAERLAYTQILEALDSGNGRFGKRSSKRRI
jgi:CheY-like chemotaxis protein